jgi:hypothetical protein
MHRVARNPACKQALRPPWGKVSNDSRTLNSSLLCWTPRGPQVHRKNRVPFPQHPRSGGHSEALGRVAPTGGGDDPGEQGCGAGSGERGGPRGLRRWPGHGQPAGRPISVASGPPGPSRPLPAGGSAQLGSASLAACHPGRGAPAGRAAACSPQERRLAVAPPQTLLLQLQLGLVFGGDAGTLSSWPGYEGDGPFSGRLRTRDKLSVLRLRCSYDRCLVRDAPALVA